jgi:uncharacterized protein DUF6468
MTTLVIEGLLIFLLVITIGYCFILDQRLKVMRAGQADLRMVITDLARTTQAAQDAVSGLRATADDVDRKLSAKLDEARALTGQLEHTNHSNHAPVVQDQSGDSQAPAGNTIFLRRAG